MKRLRDFSHRHPLLSILAGWIFFVAIVLVAVPKDPDYVDAAVHVARAT